MSLPISLEPGASEPIKPAPAIPAPAEKPAVSQPPVRGIEYLRAFRYVLDHRDWLKGLLIFTVFSLIPILQTPMAFGYAYTVTEHLHRRLPGPYPLFDFRQFAVYITRGIWCYLITDMLAVIIGPVIQIFTQGGMFGSMMAIQADEQVGPILVAIGIPLLIILFLLIVVALSVLFTPLYMRAGLSQDFVQTFNFRWIGNFLQRMWLETFLVNLFLILSFIAALPLGCVVPCYGWLFAAAYLTLVGSHLTFQLYELYLARGGEPIPLKPLPADVPPVVTGH